MTPQIKIDDGKEPYLQRVKHHPIDKKTFAFIRDNVKRIGVTDRFIDIIKTFDVKPGITPAGFRIVFNIEEQTKLMVDLVRDIS